MSLITRLDNELLTWYIADLLLKFSALYLLFLTIIVVKLRIVAKAEVKIGKQQPSPSSGSRKGGDANYDRGLRPVIK